ncbi:hypothetical protein KKB68_02105, partial [Patescibacteria group bacterium]|nr:hypothetical protein [Patescibacteria group bacterium]
LTSHLSPEPFGGEVFPPTEVMGGIIEEAAKESLGLDTAMFPNTINLEAGYSVWSTMAELLPDFGNTDLQEVVQEVCKASGVGVEEWNLPGRVIDRLLPVGFELEITPEVKEIIQAIIDKRG